MWEEVPNNWHVAGIGDFNGDGIADILWRSDDGAISNWLGTGTGGFTINDANALSQVGTSWNVPGVGDFNGDGRDDVLWSSNTGAMSDWLALQSGGFVVNDSAAYHQVGTDWHIVGTGDFNGDGRTDILWRSDTGALSNWLGQANGGFVANDSAAMQQVGLDWKVAGVADFNGDGKADILWRNDSGRLSEWLGQANGGFSDNLANTGQNVPLDWKVAGTGDFNGDGRSDILWRETDGTISNWLGQANGGFVSNDANASQPLNNVLQIAGVGDFNGDHKDDMLLRSSDGSLQTWVGSTSGAILSPTEKLWQDAVDGARSLMAEMTSQAISGAMVRAHTGVAPVPQQNYMAGQLSAAIGDAWYLATTSNSTSSNVNIFNVIVDGSDPSFQLFSEDDTTVSLGFGDNFDSMTLIDSVNSLFSIAINGISLIADWISGLPSGPLANPGDIVITGIRAPDSATPGPAIYEPSGYFFFDANASGFNFNDGYGGGGSTQGIVAGAVRRTAEGHTYIIDINLNPQQSLVLDQIVDYGLDHGYTAKEIAVAATDAFYESGFSQSAVNGSHVGLFQYDSSTWAANGEAGSINNLFDQIRAIFSDISRYESRYTTAWNDTSSGLASAGLSFGQYFEIKHELGNNSISWNAVNPATGNTYISDWAAKAATLNIH